ncbi:Scr1 family TA system antitoxin-like transcriptional regulator [Nocardiopsis sp. NPDC050513]|uniref:Scr1 family TA system antitoxin-like transcriptional regulator n=1 Tax=Nocardiopsis sp. NPDC050513 TaxID=3364338 RepID=UPI0037BAD9E3
MSAQDFCKLLKEARRNAGITQDALGRIVGVVGGTVSRWENGENLPDRDVAEALDRALKCNGRLIRAWQYEATGSIIPHWRRPLEQLRRASHTIEAVVPNAVPDLLQAVSYARMMLEEAMYPGTDEEIQRVAERQASQYDLLRSNGNPWVVAVFPVYALTCLPDGVRRDQVNRLLSLTGAARVRVHLIPEDTPVSLVAPVVLFHQRDGGTVAAGEHVRGLEVYDEPTDIERLAGQAKRMLGAALPMIQSRTLMEGMLK